MNFQKQYKKNKHKLIRKYRNSCKIAYRQILRGVTQNKQKQIRKCKFKHVRCVHKTSQWHSQWNVHALHVKSTWVCAAQKINCLQLEHYIIRTALKQLQNLQGVPWGSWEWYLYVTKSSETHILQLLTLVNITISWDAVRAYMFESSFKLLGSWSIKIPLTYTHTQMYEEPLSGIHSSNFNRLKMQKFYMPSKNADVWCAKKMLQCKKLTNKLLITILFVALEMMPFQYWFWKLKLEGTYVSD